MLDGNEHDPSSPDLGLIYGDDYLHAITKHLSDVIGAKHVFIGDLLPPENRRVRALHFWAGDRYLEGYEYDLANTPCDNVMGKGTCSYPHNVQDLFPLDEDLKTFNIQAYAASPIFSKSGDVLGLLVALHDEPFTETQTIEATLKAHAGRVGAELEASKAIETVEKTALRFSAVFDQTGVPSAILDTQYTIVRANKAFSSLLGLKLDELLNHPFPVFTAPDHQDVERALFDTLTAQAQKTVRMEKRLISPSGDSLFVDQSMSTIVNMEDQVVNYIVISQDITERVKAEKYLQQLEKDYEDFYNHAPDMFVSVDPKTAKILDCNQTLVKNLGYDKDDIVGQTIFSVYHPDCMDDVHAAFNSFVETGIVKNAELQLKRKDGSKIDVMLNVSAVRDDDGNIVHSRSVWRDISDRIEAQKAIADAMDQAVQANQAKSEFLANMSHELRTPLNSVIGFSEMMKYQVKGPIPDGYQEDVDSILLSGKLLLETVDSILDIAKIESGQFELDTQLVFMGDIVDEVVSILSVRADDKGIDLINDTRKMHDMLIDPYRVK